MPAKITYYAIVNEFSSRERPGGVVRRIEDDDGQRTRRSPATWSGSTLDLYSYERGDGDNELHEISEDEANRIVERIRRTVAGTRDAPPASGVSASGLGSGRASGAWGVRVLG